MIDKGMYKMEKRGGQGLSLDDDTRKTVAEDNKEEGITDREGGDVALEVDKTSVVETDWNSCNGVRAPFG